MHNSLTSALSSTNANWIVFGDDWGAHPSTTQHLILNMPANNQAIWIDSIGMRGPELNLVDFRRIISKGSALLRRSEEQSDQLYKGSIGKVSRIKPRILPWHTQTLAVTYNRRWLKNQVFNALKDTSSILNILMTSNPVVAYYSDVLPADKLVYLRLDDYGEYPGCDPHLVADAEKKIFAKADLIVATAKNLLPGGEYVNKCLYLPQGVQIDIFSDVPTEPPKNGVLGFFGCIASWLDFDLIVSVAKALPDWQLEFIGKPDYIPSQLREIDNIKILPPVRFDQLAKHIGHWSAAWIPFKINKLTKAVNPLKVREYLAAGLPTHCTPLPEVAELGGDVLVTSDATNIVNWLQKCLVSDSVEKRLERRASVIGDSWSARSSQLLQSIIDYRPQL